MKIDFFAPRWGSESLSWADFAGKAIAEGYDGVEVFPLPAPQQKNDLLASLADNGLKLILQHIVLSNGSDFNQYIAELKENLYQLATYQRNDLKPLFINSQTGREYYTYDQMARCFDVCDTFTKDTGIKIVHETHRNKWSYAAHVTADMLKKFADVRLTFDVSHWVCVSESYLEDQDEAVALALQHTDHLHARVGHPEGPQVTDPRAPENAMALEKHIQWWHRWIAMQQAKGVQLCTITPEFGPYPYMSHKPFTTEPITNQWEINAYMKDMLKARYQHK